MKTIFKKTDITFGKDDFKEVLFTREDLKLECKRVAKEIEDSSDFCAEDSVFVYILEGAIHFFVELSFNFKSNIAFDSIRATSYNVNKNDKVKISKDLHLDVKGKTVYLVDEIIDSGNTMLATRKYILEKGAKEVKIIAMIYKPHKVVVPLQVDHYCFDFNNNNDWLIGIGLNCNERCRALPFVASVKPEGIKKLKKLNKTLIKP